MRGVEAHTTIDSPPAHTAFSNPLEMMSFIQQLRALSKGKPIGIKLCVGRQSEFAALCMAMIETGVKPDFIVVDGGEGGTGAAPLEFSNSIGMPLRDGLTFVCDSLTGFSLKQDIRVIAVGKVFSAFHICKNLALGADMVYSARGMMLALGCVQSLICNSNHCPTGVATQNQRLANGLDVTDKSVRVARFHAETLERLVEITAATGLTDVAAINRTHIYRRVNVAEIRRYDEIYPYITPGCLLGDVIPERFAQTISEANSASFMPNDILAQHESGLAPLGVH